MHQQNATAETRHANIMSVSGRFLSTMRGGVGVCVCVDVVVVLT